MKNCLLAVFYFFLFTSQLNAQCAGFDMSILSNDPTCYGFNDGSATFNPIAGNGGNTFTISNSTGTILNAGNSNTINSLPEGWYYCTIEDALGCITEDSIFIQQPAEMAIDLTITDLLCYQDDMGFAIIDTVYNYAGSFPNFANIGYYWNPNPTGTNGIGENELQNVPAGNYSVTINDVNGCAKVFDFTINEPPIINVSALCTNPCTPSMSDGIVQATASGGTPGYFYLWTNQSTFATNTSSTWGGLLPGNYEIEVTDVNGCAVSTIVTVGYLSLSEKSNTGLSVYPTLVQNQLLQINNELQTNSVFQIINLAGEKVAEQNGQNGQNTIEINLPNATYLYHVVSSETNSEILHEGKIVVAN